MNTTDISYWLEMKYLDWQKTEKRTRTIKEFAEFLGIPQSTLNNYLRGNRTPSETHVRRLANKLGMEIYALLGIMDKEDEIYQILAIYDKLDQQRREELLVKAEMVLSQKE